MIAFIQACGLDTNEHGGSARIFRSLLDTEHPPVLSINTHSSTHFSAAPASERRSEIHIPLRSDFGRLEYTRLSGSLGLFDGLYSWRFERRLSRAIKDHGIKVIHLLANCYSVVPVSRVASALGI